MEIIEVNYLSVLVAAVASMFVGFLWYGLFFKKTWMEIMGYTNESMAGMKMTANKAYTIAFVASLVMAYVLKYVIVLSQNFYELPVLAAGISTAFWIWLGFFVPTTLGVVLWENKPWKLWFINTSYYLVSLVAMSIILSLW